MAFIKTLEIINVGAAAEVKTAKGGYKSVEVAFKQDGKVAGKKLVSFTNEAIFAQVQTLKPGDVVDVTMEKDKNDYWQWTAIVPAGSNGETTVTGKAVVESVANSSRGQTGRVTGSNYETPAERASRQRYIVRQSSIANALKFMELAKQKPTREELVDLGDFLVAYVYEQESNQAIIEMDNDIPI